MQRSLFLKRQNRQQCDARGVTGRELLLSASRRGWLSLAGAFVLAAGLAACAGLPFGNDYTFSEAQLQRALDRKFPFDRHVLAVLDVNLSHPRLTLLPERNRLAVAVDATIAHPLDGAPFTGTLAIESALAYDPATMSVVLRDPEVRNFTVDRLPERWSRQLNAAGALIATQLLQGAPIYTFKPEQLNIGGVPRQPGQITVLSHGVNVRFDSR
ncbi:hypothetical protein PMO31116_01788 [Pandoraea morbifera]|uniref:DUF1439 domain-containing protein n=1 Tax=Pandoraea morbifera TaxID=2508300 RepID=A0A5E4U8Q7_9BURK|nr:DUF1439 domain-containing protein [Pandoraea morbifera]VVD94649.1 hypothetical protein PMO31116_01788 [Pandoraea morbifera]